MTLIVEDGTGLIDAESYVSVSHADIYHEKLGNADWLALDDSEKEQSLRKATNYIGLRFKSEFKGIRAFVAQALDFPREHIYLESPLGLMPKTLIPLALKNASCELALKSNYEDLMPETDTRVKSEKVDVIQITYDEHSQGGVRFVAIEAMLSDYIQSNSKSSMTQTVQRG